MTIKVAFIIIPTLVLCSPIKRKILTLRKYIYVLPLNKIYIGRYSVCVLKKITIAEDKEDTLQREGDIENTSNILKGMRRSAALTQAKRREL